jgi:hypothetical protein
MMTNHSALYRFCSALRRKGALALCLALCMLGLGLSASAQQGTFITIDAPGAYQGTYASAISAAGDITGYYQDINGVVHGFVRSAHGRMTTFDAPGAGTRPAPTSDSWLLTPDPPSACAVTSRRR